MVPRWVPLMINHSLWAQPRWAISESRFDPEILPLGEVRADEGPRRGTTRENMAALASVMEGGTITAAVPSQVSDGAAAMLHFSERGPDTP